MAHEILYADNTEITRGDVTIEIPVKQYCDAIMAIQKLDDIRKVCWCSGSSNSPAPTLEAIRAIVKRES